MENKDFVPYDIALELKQLGFNKTCLAYYDRWNGKSHLIITNQSGSFESKLFRLFRKTEHTTYTQDYVEYYLTGICTAPTFSQAFRFFRENHGLWQMVIQNTDKDWTYDIMPIVGMIDYKIFDVFNTYEEAELACLIKLIEIIKQQDNGK